MKTIKEQSEVNKKEENNCETISHSANQDNIEEEALNKSFEKIINNNNININNESNNIFNALCISPKEKYNKGFDDAIALDFTEVEYNFNKNNNNNNFNNKYKNQFNKFVIYKNTQNINIARLSTADLIKIINKNSKAFSFGKNSDLKDKEFTYKNQRKKLRNIASSNNKKSAMQGGLSTLVLNSNNNNIKALANFNSVNFSNEENMIVPFDAEISVKSPENGLHKGNQLEELNTIREKIGNQVKVIF